MKNRVLLDFALTLVIYIAYFAITIFAVGTQDDVENLEPMLMIGVSLACSLLWYVLGKWGFKPPISKGTWYGTWVVLLAIILITATVFYWLYYPASSFTILDFVAGPICFYLSTMLFSPFRAKFLIWPASKIRSW